jgi:N-formylmaleamate deformylase
MRTLLLSLCLTFSVTTQSQAAAFAVEVSGPANKPAMLLIPGLASGGEVWNDTVARYKDRYQCHVFTLAGFAGVPALESDETFLERVRQDLAAYIREQKLKQPVVVGHSLGGYLAMALAASEPTLVGPLVIVDSLPHLGGVYPPSYDAAGMRDGIVNQPREQYDAFVKSGVMYRSMVTGEKYLPILTKWGLASDQKTVGNAMYELTVANLIKDLPKIQSRSLVLGTWYGMKDFTTREQVEKNFRVQYQSLPNHTFALADTARHFVMYDDPNWFFSHVDAFLAAKK